MKPVEHLGRLLPHLTPERRAQVERAYQQVRNDGKGGDGEASQVALDLLTEAERVIPTQPKKTIPKR